MAESFGNIGKAAHIVKIIVEHNEWIFEPEAEAYEPEVQPEPEAQVEIPFSELDEQETLHRSTLEALPADAGAASSSAPSPISKDTPLPDPDSTLDAQAQDTSNPSDSELETASEGRTPALEISQEELDTLAELHTNNDLTSSGSSGSNASPASLLTIPPPTSFSDMIRLDSSQSEPSLPSPALSLDPSSPNSLSPTQQRPQQRIRDPNSSSNRGREESVYLDATESLATLNAFEKESPARSSLPPPSREGDVEELEGTGEAEEKEELDSELDRTFIIDSIDSRLSSAAII